MPGSTWCSAEDEEELLWETDGEYCAQALVVLYVWQLFFPYVEGKNTEHYDIFHVTNTTS